MAVWTVGDHIEAAVVFSFKDVAEQINVWDWRVSVGSVDPEADFSSDLQDYFADLYSGLNSQISDQVDAVELRWRNVTNDGPTIFSSWAAGGASGTGGGDALPPQNAALVLLRTATKGVQGKKYLPTFTEGTQTDGLLTGGTLVAVQDFADLLLSPAVLAMTGAELTLCVYSPTQDELFTVINAQAREQMAIQRRRRVGRGS